MWFLAPYMLLGCLAAGIPIVLHLFYRSRHRDVPWAAMTFLLAAMEQTSRRLKFQELLLLILRVALLLLLAFALARPTFQVSGNLAPGQVVDAVLLIDQSMSMAGQAGVAPARESSDPYENALRQFAAADRSVTRFDRARAAALAVLSSLPTGSTVQVIGVSDRAVVLGPRTPSHLDQARTIIEGMTPTSTRTNLESGFTQAERILKAGTSPGKELYLFSDMQRAGFDQNANRIADTLQGMRESTSLHFIHCGKQKLRNVAVVGITPQTTLRSGERADFAILIRNTGDEVANNLTVSLQIDGNANNRDARPVQTLEPNTTRAVVLSGLLASPGRHYLTATVRHDDLAGDNRLDRVIQVNDQVGVLVVDGSPNPGDPQRGGAFYLRHALDPTAGQTSSLPMTVTSADQASPRQLGGKEVCILVNVQLEGSKVEKGGDPERTPVLSKGFVRALADFVQAGHSLIIFPGDHVDPEAYNQVLFDQFQLLPYRIAKIEKRGQQQPWLLDRESTAGGPFGRFRQEQEYASLNRIETRQRLGLIENGKGKQEQGKAQRQTGVPRVLLRYNDGKPFLASWQRPGEGKVLLFTTSVHDSKWTDLFVMAPAFVPMVQVSLNDLLEGEPGQFNRTAGEAIEWQVPRDDADLAHDLVVLERFPAPDEDRGSRQRVGYPLSREGRSLLSVSDVRLAGLYHLVPAGREVDTTSPLIAVAPDTSETGDLQSLKSDDIDQLVGFSVRHLDASGDGQTFSGTERYRSEWTTWLLVLLLFFVLGEMALAWWCGRSW